MLERRPLFDEYWATKVAPIENIDIPMYITASFTTGFHSKRSFDTFQYAKSKDKWLRVHPYQECMFILALILGALYVNNPRV